MTNEDFSVYFTERFNEISQLRERKAKEYTKENAFENFEKASKFLSIPREKAALYYMTKHIISLKDIIEHKDNLHLLKEKTNDMVIYLILLEAMLLEEMENDKVNL